MSGVGKWKKFDSEYVRTLIRVKAKRLKGRAGIRQSDLEDVEQELWLGLLQKVSKFDPARGSAHTFADRVVDSLAKMMLRKQKRLKRAPGFRAQSLETLIECDGGFLKSIEETISSADVDRRTGNQARSEQEQRELEEAMGAALAAMPPELRSVCQLILTGTQRDAAARSGLSRKKLADAKAAIGEILERMGLNGT